MDDKENIILNQMRIYITALKTLLWLDIQNMNSAQFDVTMDNLMATSLMLKAEARRQRDALKRQ